MQRTESKGWSLEFPPSEFVFAVYQVRVTSSLAVAITNKQMYIYFHKSKLSCFVSFPVSMQFLRRYFTPVFLFYFLHAFGESTLTWVNSELKWELKGSMLSHRLEMLSLLRQVQDLNSRESMWVVSMFIIHCWLLKASYRSLRK